MNGKQFEEWLEDMVCACEEIKGRNLCGECPMLGNCIEEATLIQIACDCPSWNFDEFVKMGKDPDWYITPSDVKEEMLNAYR